MTERKLRVFIGSSSEGKTIARNIVHYFALNGFDQFDCVPWWDTFFENGCATHAEIVKKGPSFDFALFICTPDEQVERISNHEQTQKTRDNVMFEIGYFTGAISKYRTFILRDTACTLPTDFNGIEVHSFFANDESGYSLKAACDRLMQAFLYESKRLRLGLLPSIDYAQSYVTSFLSSINRAFINNPSAFFLDNTISTEDAVGIDVNIFLPHILSNSLGDWIDSAKMRIRMEHKTTLHETNLNNNYKVLVPDNWMDENHRIQIYDIPRNIYNLRSILIQLGFAPNTGDPYYDQAIMLEIDKFYAKVMDHANDYAPTIRVKCNVL